MLVHDLDRSLTLLSLAQSEIMWEFIKCSQVTTPVKRREGFNLKERPNEFPKTKSFTIVGSTIVVGKLIELSIELEKLLLSYRSSICRHRIRILKVKSSICIAITPWPIRINSAMCSQF